MQMQQQGAGGADQRRGKEAEEEELVLATWDCGSPLYDSFELAALHHVLESHLMVLPFPGAAVSRSRRLDHTGIAAVSRCQRFDHTGVVARPDVIDRGVGRRRRKGRRRTGWKGSRAAAAVLRAVTCWKSL